MLADTAGGAGLADRPGGLESGGEEAGPEGEAEGADEGRKEAEGEEGEEEEPQELELDEEREAQQDQEGGLKRFSSGDESFEEELMVQLEEYEQVIQEFQLELGVARTRYNLATGGRRRRRGRQAQAQAGWQGSAPSPPRRQDGPSPTCPPAGRTNGSPPPTCRQDGWFLVHPFQNQEP